MLHGMNFNIYSCFMIPKMIKKFLFFNILFVLQAVCMFIGEFSCLIVFKLWQIYQRQRLRRGSIDEVNLGNQKFNPIIFLAPAMCDMTGTSLMYGIVLFIVYL